MSDHHHTHDHPPAGPRPHARHAASLARAGVGLRVLIALALVAATWAAILPLVS